MKAGGREPGGGGGEGEPYDGRHDIRGRSRGVVLVADEQGYAGAVEASGVGWRGLGEDDAGGPGRGQVCDGSELQLNPAQNE